MANNWFKSENGVKMGKRVVLDGSDIEQLVEDKERFSKFVDCKFKDLDVDNDGKLSVKELKPAVADIGAALGLPPQGSSPESDHIYSEVLNEFTRGKQEKVSKAEFQKVLSDILLGMAAGLKRDPIVILRIDGEDLYEFVKSPRFEPEAISIFSSIESANPSLKESLKQGLRQLTVEHGMPPVDDAWVMTNIIEPALENVSPDRLAQAVSQDIFFEEFKKLLENIVKRLQEHPVIVAHSENTFDGNGVRRLLSNKFELDKLLDSIWNDLPKDRHNKTSKEYFRVALDKISTSAGLPPYGAVDQVDAVINEACKMVNADDGKVVDEVEFKKTIAELLGSIMLQLEGNPVFVSTNSVVHEPISTNSTILPPTALPVTNV